MKNFKYWLTTMAMLLCCVAASAEAVQIDGIWYDLNPKDQVAGVGGLTDEMVNSSVIVIPETVNYNNVEYRVTEILDWAFYYYCSLTSVTIPEGVTSIGSRAFYGCSSLTAITIPESMTSIGNGAFYDCSSLTSITIPEKMTLIESSAFYGTAWYDNQPDGVVYIGKILYSYKGEMPENTSIQVREGTVSISPYAFDNCRNLTSITLPESVTLIGGSAFRGTAWYDNQPDGVVYAGKILYSYKGEMPEKTSIGVREGTVSIGSAFSHCRNLASITLPESVISIEDYAFYECSSLNSIVLSEGVNKIGSFAFCNCSSLASIIIPTSVTSIEGNAFDDCSSLTSITIPAGVISVEDGVFSGCSSLKELTIEDGPEMLSLGNERYYGIDSDFNTIEFVLGLFDECPLEYVYLGRNLNYISEEKYGYSPFCNKNELRSVSIGNSVTSIGDNLFFGCGTLSSITIPEGMTSIGEQAFYNCSNLTSITIPKGVTSLNNTFSGCTSLKEIVIEDGSETLSLGKYIFSDSPLEKVYLGRDLNYNNILSGHTPFYGRDKLTSVVIGDSVTSIGHEAFYGCSSLTSINIPDGVTSIGGRAFSDCSNLKELSLGKGLKKIEENAFSNSENIEKITIYATRPPSADGYIFSDATYDNATLYVPQGSVLKYQVMTGWSGFYNISEIEGGTTEYLTISQADNGAVGIAVDFGRTYKVCITPSEGWAVHSVTFNGEDITAQLGEDNTLTTPTINGSAELNVAYEQLGGNEVKSTRTNAIKVSGYEGIITVDGCADGELITIYTTDGAIAAQQKAEGESTRISVATGQLYIIKVADKVVKILM